jgi:hypothetical protein
MENNKSTIQAAVKSILREPVLIDFFIQCNVYEVNDHTIIANVHENAYVPLAALKDILYIKYQPKAKTNRHSYKINGINKRSVVRINSRISKMLNEQYEKVFEMLDEYQIEHRKQYAQKSIDQLSYLINLLDKEGPGYWDLREDVDAIHKKYMALIKEEVLAEDFPELAKEELPTSYLTRLERQEKRMLDAQKKRNFAAA